MNIVTRASRNNCGASTAVKAKKKTNYFVTWASGDHTNTRNPSAQEEEKFCLTHSDNTHSNLMFNRNIKKNEYQVSLLVRLFIKTLLIPRLLLDNTSIF